MSYNTSPNMGLQIPVVGNEPGPNYATDVNNSLTLIDAHNHSPGYGVQITPSGLNINTALTFGNNFATNVAGVTFTAQSSPPTVGTIYESGNDLYFVDGIGNNVRITQSGSVAGTPGSIANLVPPASASYVSSSATFVWQSNAGVAANLDAASVSLRNITPNSTYAVTLAPPSPVTSNYQLTLPTIPVLSTSFLQVDRTGNITGSIAVSGALTTSNLSPTAGILGSQLSASADITGSQLAATAGIVGTQLSSSANILGSQMTTNADFPGTSVRVDSQNVVSSSVNTTNGFMILRGYVAANGTVIGGEGFTVSHTIASGVYNISFSSAFSDNPVVVAGLMSPTGVGNWCADASAVTSSGMTVVMYDTTNTGHDQSFSFIAIGQR